MTTISTALNKKQRNSFWLTDLFLFLNGDVYAVQELQNLKLNTIIEMAIANHNHVPLPQDILSRQLLKQQCKTESYRITETFEVYL